MSHEESSPSHAGAPARVRRAGDALLVAAFLLTITVPAAGLFRSGTDRIIEEVEYRRAAAFPALAFGPETKLTVAENLQRIPREFELWFNDHVALRRELIRGYNRARIAGVVSSRAPAGGVAPATGGPVLVGREGWLFFTGDEVLADYRCTDPFTPEQLDEWKRALTARRDWLRARGIPYVVVVPPNTHTIYPEFLPSSVTRVGAVSRLDQLIEHLRGPDGIEIVDLRAPLRGAKSRADVYRKTDTHWNEFGAFVGYEQILHALRPVFPELRPWSFDDFELQEVEVPGGDLSRMLDAGVTEHAIRLVPRRPRHAEMTIPPKEDGQKLLLYAATNPGGELESAYVLHDSFMPTLAPFFNEHWKRVGYAWTYEFPTYDIEAARPQVVIQEFTERKLMTARLLVNPPELEAPAGRLAAGPDDATRQ